MMDGSVSARGKYRVKTIKSYTLLSVCIIAVFCWLRFDKAMKNSVQSLFIVFLLWVINRVIPIQRFFRSADSP